MSCNNQNTKFNIELTLVNSKLGIVALTKTVLRYENWFWETESNMLKLFISFHFWVY